MKSKTLLIQVEQRIFLVRGQKVMLDADLAELYRVPTKSLNLAVKRNADRFPEDFAFQLTEDEVAGLRFQFETSKRGRGGRRYLPHAFTEQGVAMFSSVGCSRRTRLDWLNQSSWRLRTHNTPPRDSEAAPGTASVPPKNNGTGPCPQCFHARNAFA